MARRSGSAGSKKRLAPDKWKLTVTVTSYPVANGKWVQRRRSETFRGTAREAEQRLREMQTRVEHGVLPADGRRTLGAWLDEWSTDWCRALAPITIDKYRSLLRTYVSDQLRATRLDKLTPSHVQSLIAELERAGKGARTIHLLRAVIRVALNQALQLGYVDRNVAAGKFVQLPAYRRLRRRALSEAEVNSILTAARGEKGELLVKFLLFTGARPAEALAFQFGAIDGVMVRIEQALTWPRGGGFVVKEPKTANGKRDVPITAEIGELVREQRKARMQSESLTSTFVFQTRRGTPYDIAGARRHLIDPILRKAGIAADVSPYCFRHTAASLMMKAGVPLPVIAKILGHYDPRFTAAQYVHTDAEQIAGALEAYEKLLETA